MSGRVSDKEKEIVAAKASVQELEKAQSEIKKLGSDSLTIFKANVEILSQVWKFARSDAIKVKGFLKDSKKDIVSRGEIRNA